MSAEELAGGSKKGPAMEWMYKPTALVNREDYLLGRTVDKSLKMLDEAEKGNAFSYADEVEKDRTPISIFAKPAGPAGPVDLIKKIKEDPLYQIHKKEEENLKQLLKNPVRMKQLRELADLREKGSSSAPTPSSAAKSKEKSKKHSSKHKKKHSKKKKRRSSSSDDSSSSESEGEVVKSAKTVTSFEDLDRLLSAKLLSLKDKSKDKGKKEEPKPAERLKDRTSDRELEDRDRVHRPELRPQSERYRLERRDHREPPDPDRDRNRHVHNDRERDERHSNRSHGNRDRDERRSGYRERSRSPRPRDRETDRSGPSKKPESRKAVAEDELERKRLEMMENAKWRDVQRTKNVTKYREEQQKEEEKNKKELDPDFIRKQLMEAATTGSIEKRIKSNSYNIQKSKSAMNLNFARR